MTGCCQRENSCSTWPRSYFNRDPYSSFRTSQQGLHIYISPCPLRYLVEQNHIVCSTFHLSHICFLCLPIGIDPRNAVIQCFSSQFRTFPNANREVVVSSRDISWYCCWYYASTDNMLMTQGLCLIVFTCQWDLECLIEDNSHQVDRSRWMRYDADVSPMLSHSIFQRYTSIRGNPIGRKCEHARW